MKRSNTFLGQGWAFPPAFARSLNAVLLTSEEENIRENLQILFSTQQGERILNEGYGVSLLSFVFSTPDGDLITEINESIRNAVLFYEPRIKLNDVSTVVDEKNPALLNISIDYTVRTTNSRQNYVYPFYINEGTNLKK
jgi:hypothetical protein